MKQKNNVTVSSVKTTKNKRERLNQSQIIHVLSKKIKKLDDTCIWGIVSKKEEEEN